MSAPLVFLMGKFAAHLPADRCYARNHMWAAQQGDAWRFGLSAYAVRLLQDVYFLDWSIDPGTHLRERQPIGQIESSKAESELYAPIAGELLAFNPRVLSDPAQINADPYGAGWLFELRNPAAELLSPEGYLAHLSEAWPVAERTIKGQLNEADD